MPMPKWMDAMDPFVFDESNHRFTTSGFRNDTPQYSPKHNS